MRKSWEQMNRIFARVSRFYLTLSTIGLACAAALLIQGNYQYGLALLAGSIVFYLSGRHHWKKVHEYADEVDQALRTHLVHPSAQNTADSPEAEAIDGADAFDYEIVDPLAFSIKLSELASPVWMTSSHRRLMTAVNDYLIDLPQERSDTHVARAQNVKQIEVVEAAGELAARLERA